MNTSRITMAALAISAVIHAAPAWGLSPGEHKLLSLIAVANKTNMQSLASFDCRFSLNLTMAEDAQETSVAKQGRYAFSGERVFSQEELVRNGHALPALTVVRNGGMIRQITDYPSRLIVMGTEDRSNLKTGTPSPWDMVGGGLSREIDNLTEQQGTVTSVTRRDIDGRSMVVVELAQRWSVAGQHHMESTAVIFYSVEDGYMPVKVVVEAEHPMQEKERITAVGTVPEVLAYDVSGSTVYLPGAYEETYTVGSEIIREMAYHIDSESVRINPDLAPDLFTVRIRPTDQVINRDIGMEVMNPFGVQFLAPETIDDVRPELAAPSNTVEVEYEGDALVLPNGVKIKLVWIPPGQCVIGSPDDELGQPDYIAEINRKRGRRTRDPAEGPPHVVHFPTGFYMAVYETTCEQYRAFKPDYRRIPQEHSHKDPAYVTWSEAKAFCDWASEVTGRRIRLPSEAEWEYACRAGNQTRFFWGDSAEDACRYANVLDSARVRNQPELARSAFPCDDGYSESAPVGSYKPNTWGLYDMIGNVAEWCRDDYHGEAYVSPARENGSAGKVHRGGGFWNGVTFARCAARGHAPAESRGSTIGFRVLVEPGVSPNGGHAPEISKKTKTEATVTKSSYRTVGGILVAIGVVACFAIAGVLWARRRHSNEP